MPTADMRNDGKGPVHMNRAFVIPDVHAAISRYAWAGTQPP